MSDPVVFSAGSKTMTKSEFDALMQDLPENLKTQLASAPDGPRRLAEQLAEVVIYADEARRLKLNEKASVKAQIYLQQESALSTALYQHLFELSKPSEADVKAWYDGRHGDYENAKARHILIRFQGSRVPIRQGQKDLTDAEALTLAQQIRERLVKGEDFAAVAKAESDDAGSGAQGGNLGAFGRGRMVPGFEQAVFTLPIGEISQPVKTQFGYHLIQVQERTVRKFEEVRAEIEKKLQGDAAKKAMEAVQSSAKKALDEGYFGKRAAAVK